MLLDLLSYECGDGDVGSVVEEVGDLVEGDGGEVVVEREDIDGPPLSVHVVDRGHHFPMDLVREVLTFDQFPPSRDELGAREEGPNYSFLKLCEPRFFHGGHSPHE